MVEGVEEWWAGQGEHLIVVEVNSRTRFSVSVVGMSFDFLDNVVMCDERPG